MDDHAVSDAAHVQDVAIGIRANDVTAAGLRFLAAGGARVTWKHPRLDQVRRGRRTLIEVCQVQSIRRVAARASCIRRRAPRRGVGQPIRRRRRFACRRLSPSGGLEQIEEVVRLIGRPLPRRRHARRWHRCNGPFYRRRRWCRDRLGLRTRPRRGQRQRQGAQPDDQMLTAPAWGIRVSWFGNHDGSL